MFDFLKQKSLDKNSNFISSKDSDSIETFKTIKIKSSQINKENLEKLYFENETLKLVIGFVSPNLDFKDISSKIKNYLPNDTKLILSSTAGELCTFDSNIATKKLYEDTNDNWDNIVLSGFSSYMIGKGYILETVNFRKLEASNSRMTKGRYILGRLTM